LFAVSDIQENSTTADDGFPGNPGAARSGKPLSARMLFHRAEK
jgi:hypothetical protein